MHTINDFLTLEAMKYYDKSDDNKLSPNLLQRKYDIINNKGNAYIASQKWDGNWMMFIKLGTGEIAVRGRSKNVKGEYENYAPKMPHLVEEFAELVPNNTVILAEVCWPELSKVATDVGTILRCLPAKAVERQKEHKLVAKVFDVLMYDGEDLTSTGYYYRIFDNYGYKRFVVTKNYFQWTEFYFDKFDEAADDIIARGGEGVVIQEKNYIYEPGKRTAWKTLKLKQKLPEMELKVIGVLEPEKHYNGIEISLWDYWEREYLDGTTDLEDNFTANTVMDDHTKRVYPVTKPYYYGWKIGVIVDYDGNEVKVSSGATDEDKAWLATGEAAAEIAAGNLFAVIRGMQESTNANGTKSIRHPVLVKLRTDVKED